jgi:hypothetical protein
MGRAVLALAAPALLGVTLLQGCGNRAAPASFVVVAQAAATANLAAVADVVDADGFCDFGSTEFDRGLLLYTRWSVRPRGPVRTVELFVDVTHDDIPSSRVDDLVLTKNAGEVQVTVRNRGVDGLVVGSQYADAATVTLYSANAIEGRPKTSGELVATLPSAEFLYDRIDGVWNDPLEGALLKLKVAN